MKLLDNATNMFGPIGDEAKTRITRFLQNASVEGWNDIYCIVVTPSMKIGTVWQAVCAIEPRYKWILNNESSGENGSAAERWSMYPDAITVARAIKQAIQSKAERVSP